MSDSESKSTSSDDEISAETEETELRKKLLKRKAELEEMKAKEKAEQDKQRERHPKIVWDEDEDHVGSGVFAPAQSKAVQPKSDRTKRKEISPTASKSKWRSSSPIQKRDDKSSWQGTSKKQERQVSMRSPSPKSRRRDVDHRFEPREQRKEDKRREREDKKRDERDRKKHRKERDERSEKHSKDKHRPRHDDDNLKKKISTDLTKEDVIQLTYKIVDGTAYLRKATVIEDIEHSDGELQSPTPKKPEDEGSASELEEAATDKKFSKFESSDSEAEIEEKRPERTPTPDVEPEQQSSQAPPTKKLKLGEFEIEEAEAELPDDVRQLPVYFPGISGCRSVEEFQCINRIEEGTYGVVYRAQERRTDEIVALKRLKMEKEKEGFPITALREINMLLKAGSHPNIVRVREIVVGSNMDKIYLAMDYVEHDMKSLMENIDRMKKNFQIGEIKTLMKQLLSGVHHLHDNWILHRDLKTSNLLLSHRGILKIGDFGLAREYGSPLLPYTPIVVTLWYRAPELLLGTKEYSCPIDMWSVGAIFAEFITLKPIFNGRGEFDAINKIFKMLGTPNDDIWPGYSQFPVVKRNQFAIHPYNEIKKHFYRPLGDSQLGVDLLNQLLTYDPSRRITAKEALCHKWFHEKPHAVHPDLFPTWPAKSELGKAAPKKNITRAASPDKNLGESVVLDNGTQQLYDQLGLKPTAQAEFGLRFDQPKF